ncbi:MAG: integrase, partial [Endomicrobiia bacterium]|nr:integrase [Endomicrobiia bacterium]
MNARFKMDYLKKTYPRYHRVSREAKSQILDEFCSVCDYNRKYAVRLFNAPLKSEPARRVLRDTTYSQKTMDIVEAVWRASGYLWSRRLKNILSSWLPWAKLHFNITKDVEKQLLSISPATIDRRLKDKKRLIKKKIYSTTRPGSLLKANIPVKTDNWDVKEPGFLEIDLVSHGGSSCEGDFIYSLNTTDILTGWTETRAIMGKGQISALKALAAIRDSLPFDLKAIDPDNDGAFINYHLLAFCKKNKIQFTRSRPYKKDDNAHIEQK